MATAYKRVERAPNSQVNWAEVGANLTNVLKEENRVREETKASIDAASREYSKILNEVPTGENTELNKFALNAAADLQEQMLMQETLLKSGQLDPRQYTIMRQNLTDGTDQAFSLFENYNAEYTRKMEMNNAGLPIGEQGSELQNWNMSQLEGFGNFQNSKLVINPESGVMSMTKMIDDPNNPGQQIPDMNNLMSVQNLENRVKGTNTKFDVIQAAEQFNASTGLDTRVMKEMGNKYKASIFTSISDATQKAGGISSMSDEEKDALATSLGVDPADFKSITLYQEAQNNFIKSRIGSGVNSDASASVLLDFVQINPITGGEYVPMQDSPDNRALAAKDSNIIIIKSENGRMVPDLSDEQQAQADRAMKVQMDMGMDYEEKVDAEFTEREPRAKTKTELDKADGDDDLDSKVSKIGDLWGGNNAKIKGATDYFRDQNESITDVTRNSEGLTVTYLNEDGNEESRNISFYVTKANPEFDASQPVSAENPEEIRAQIAATQADVDAGRASAVGEMMDQRKSQAEFIESAGPLLTGEDDISKALERGNYDPDAKFNEDNSSTSKVTTEEAPLDYTIEKTQYVNDQLLENNITLKGSPTSSPESGDDEYVATQLNNLYGKDYGLVAKSEGAFDNIIRISVPGYEDVVVDTNNYTDAGANKELAKIRKLVLLMTKADDKKLAAELDWKGKKLDKYGSAE